MRKLVAVILISLLALSAVVIYLILPHKLNEANVGIILYVWSGALPDDWKNETKFVDFPILDLGNYSSLNETVVQEQLLLIEDAGFDFVLISWWGFEDEYEKFIDTATKLVFSTGQNINSSLKFAIMVEPTHSRQGSNSFGQPYDYAGIYNYLYETFVEPYSNLYYNHDCQPLVCFFNDPAFVPGLTQNGTVPDDSRFTEIVVGDQSYTQWTYSSNEVHTDQISIIPRFDDSGIRSPGRKYDVALSNHTYDIGWQKAIQLWRQGKISTILITSWNEYPERTEIEPHYDGTATSLDPYFLYTKTKQYIRQVRSYELNLQIHSEDYNSLTPSHLLDLGATWVRMDYEINKTEPMMTALHNKGYKILAIIDNRTAPFTTLEDWNKTLLRIVSDPVSQIIDAWEIWNEPNAVMGAYINPSTYREMLRCASGILRNSTKGLIIPGGLAPHTNFGTYLKETFTNSNIDTYYDYLGLHLYNETLPVNLGYIEEAKTATNKGLWITEIGRPSQTGTYTEETQASYLEENIGGIVSKVEKIFIYELYDHTEQKDEDPKECYFGLLTTEYRKKLAYYKLKEVS
jgi:Glycosyl hydrolase catalytic core